MASNVVVDLGMALICFNGSCHPSLIGYSTPIGEYQLQHSTIDDPRYGGDILIFKIDKEEVYAIHRVLDVPKQKRKERLAIGTSSERLITMGCINVDPKVFNELVNCCSNSKLIIHK